MVGNDGDGFVLTFGRRFVPVGHSLILIGRPTRPVALLLYQCLIATIEMTKDERVSPAHFC